MKGILTILVFLFSAALGSSVYVRNTTPRRSSYMVSMAFPEAYEVIDCISNIRDKRVCEELSYCVSLFPPRILDIYKECRTAYTGSPWADCSNPSTAYNQGELRDQIFDCVSERVGKETPEEEIAMVGSENCMRGIYLNRCMIKPRPNIYYSSNV